MELAAGCVWSDNGSTGMVAVVGKTPAQLRKEFVAMRAAIERKAWAALPLWSVFVRSAE